MRVSLLLNLHNAWLLLLRLLHNHLLHLLHL
jgi:hypothetical protein